MKRLLGLLLVMGMVGCWYPVTKLKDLGAKVRQGDDGEVISVSLHRTWHPITDVEILHLKTLVHLKDLNLIDTQITDVGVAYIRPLTRLQNLYLSGTRITDAGLVHLKGITTLKQLHLSACPKVTDAGLVHLKGMANLEALVLSETKITDAGLVHLKNLTSLQVLDLYETAITDAGLVHLAGMNLKALSIPTRADSDVGLKHYLAAIQPSTTLELNGRQITDAALVHLKGMTNLTFVDLTETKVTDAGLVHLKALANLQTLCLSDTQVTAAGAAELHKALPNCGITFGVFGIGNIMPSPIPQDEAAVANSPVQAVDASKFVERDGLTYDGDSETPFTGVSVFKYDNGQKWMEITYKDGKLVSETKWDKEGNEIK